MKKMISFLGTNEYLACIYERNDFKASETRFIQTALYEMLKNENIQIDKLYVFITEEAKKYNYDDSISRFTNTPLRGLKSVWDEMFASEPVELIPVMMNASQLEADQWELFETIYHLIEEEDELYFDITHSFRSNPVIALIISHFVKTMKNAKMKRLLYGNFEFLGPANEVKKIPVEERFAPIVDVTSMLQLLDWSIGVDSFLRTGNPIQLYELANEKSRTYHRDPGYQVIQQFSRSLGKLNRKIETVRGPKIHNEINKTIGRFEEVKSEENTIFPQFEKLTGKIEEKLSHFSTSENEVENMYGTVLWAYEHGLYQQSITLLAEHVITIVTEKLELDQLDVNNRLKVSGLLQHVIETREKAKTSKTNEAQQEDYRVVLQVEKTVDEQQLIEKINLLIDAYPELMAYKNLANLRNDINHAGFRQDSRTSRKIQENLELRINELKPFFNKIMKEKK